MPAAPDLSIRRACFTALSRRMTLPPSDPAPTFTTGDLGVYERLLFEIHGPHGREIQLDVGPTALDLYDAIAARTKATLAERTDDEAWAPDEIDLATIRVLARSILHRDYEPEFRTVTGCTFDQVLALQSKATALVRERRSGAGWYTISVGEKIFQFPSRIIRDGRGKSRQLIAVPDESSWELVYYGHNRDVAKYRGDALTALRNHPYPRDHIEEFAAESYWELEQEATRRARDLSTWSLHEHRLLTGLPSDAS